MIFKQRFLTADVGFLFRDGAMVEPLGGVMHWFNGWNNNDTPDTNNEHKTTTDGITFTSLADAPWPDNHSFAHGVEGGKIWLWGGDFLDSVRKKFIWTYNGTTYTEVNSDWGGTTPGTGVGNRILFSYGIRGAEKFIVGGQQDYTAGAGTFFNDVYKFTTGNDIVKVADLPAGMHDCSTAPLFVLSNGHMYRAGGAIYNELGHDTFYDGVWKSTNGGVTWAQVGTIPSDYVSIYQTGIVYKNRMFLLNGFNVTNKRGIIYSDDGVTWKEMPLHYFPVTHASQGCVFNDELYIISGNETTMSIKIVKIPA